MAQTDTATSEPQTHAKLLINYHKNNALGCFVQVLHRIQRSEMRWCDTCMRLSVKVDNEKEIDKMTKWIFKNLGPKTPWHISRFSPAGKRLDFPPTPIKTLKKLAQIGRNNGLEFVYIWAPGRDLPGGIYYESDTYCPKCGSFDVEVIYDHMYVPEVEIAPRAE